jgi:hypothetical protein
METKHEIKAFVRHMEELLLALLGKNVGPLCLGYLTAVPSDPTLSSLYFSLRKYYYTQSDPPYAETMSIYPEDFARFATMSSVNGHWVYHGEHVQLPVGCFSISSAQAGTKVSATWNNLFFGKQWLPYSKEHQQTNWPKEQQSPVATRRVRVAYHPLLGGKGFVFAKDQDAIFQVRADMTVSQLLSLAGIGDYAVYWVVTKTKMVEWVTDASLEPVIYSSIHQNADKKALNDERVGKMWSHLDNPDEDPEGVLTMVLCGYPYVHGTTILLPDPDEIAWSTL